MKKIIIFAEILLLILSTGCAQFGPYCTSPKIYKSSESKGVASNQAAEEARKTDRLTEQLFQERAKARQMLALSEIKDGEHKERPSGILTAEGLLGGFPVIFRNDAWRTRTLIVTKARGRLEGYKWRFTIPGKGGAKKFKLESGLYYAQWIIDGHSTIYPKNGPDIFEVTDTPHYWDDQTEQTYHGGYLLYGF